LDGSPERRSFDLKGTAEEVYEEIAKAFGLEAVYDGDFKADSKTVRVQIEQVDFREALRIAGAATSTFIVPVSDGLFMVAEDTQQKRQELEHNMAVVVPLPESVDVQEAQELARAVQQVMEIQKLVVDSTRRMVLIRDRVSKVRPAEALFRQLSQARPEVTVEVEFLEVTDKSTLSYGVDWPKTFSISFLGMIGMAGLIPITGPFSLNLWGLSLGDAQLVAAMTRNSTRSLKRATLRSVSGQPATLHVGDRYPIQSNAYIGGTPSQTERGQAFSPPPQITFEDLGVVIKVTPYVHGEDEVSIELEAEFKVLAGEALNGLPVLANRNFQATTRMKTSQWALMSGLVRSAQTKNITGIAGLADVPYLGKLFSITSKEKEDSRVLMVIKPTIVRKPAAVDIPPLWTGTETRPITVM
jgi:general secretion pathway protein D